MQITTTIKNYSRPIKIILITLLIIILLAIILMALRSYMLPASDYKEQSEEPAKLSPSLTVSASTVKEEQWPAEIVVSGPIVPWQEAIISSEITTQRLVAVLVNVGDIVKKGDILAKFNTDILLAEKAELQANWLKTAADHKRALTLKDTGAISTQDIEETLNKKAVAKALLDKKNLELHYAVVKAPNDGVISARTATVGSLGNGSSNELFRLILGGRLEWRGELTAAQLTQIKIGQSVELTLPDNSIATATVRQLAPSMNNKTRMGVVYADVAAGSNAYAEMYAKGIITTAITKALIVPSLSVVSRDGHNYVFKFATKENITKVIAQEVTVGRYRKDLIEITSGLELDERIAWHGAGFLHDGEIVKIIPDTDQKLTTITMEPS